MLIKFSALMKSVLHSIPSAMNPRGRHTLTRPLLKSEQKCARRPGNACGIFVRETVSVWVPPSPKSHRAQTKIAPTPSWTSEVSPFNLPVGIAATKNAGCAFWWTSWMWRTCWLKWVYPKITYFASSWYRPSALALFCSRKTSHRRLEETSRLPFAG